jgi:redox-sensitive bicupin YhaK (pirin superfamily)
VITIRRAAERLRTRIGWLDSRHTFSFEEHIDPRHMGFRALRVMNEDRIAPGRGFGMHPRRDLEIVTYVLEGTLRHQDSLGTDTRLEAGGLQLMSAGTGVLHSEFNASAVEPLHMLQIWITPRRTRLAPSYANRARPLGPPERPLTLIGSRDGRDGSITIHQDIAIFEIRLEPREATSTVLLPLGHHMWVQVLTGSLELNGVRLGTGDGVAVSEEATLELRGMSTAEALLFDVA